MTERIVGLIWDAWRARRSGVGAITQRQRVRLADMVAHARANSPCYRELYRDLPDRVEDPTLLPVTTKRALMARFDDWVTDREVRLAAVRPFVENLELIGTTFLGKYAVATTSGTTGTPSIFLIDDHTFRVTNALASRMLGAWLSIRDIVRIAVMGGRMSMVMATGGHFASAVAATRLQKGSRWGRKSVQVLSVHMPMAEVVAQLNGFRPAIVAPYASMASLLASEQEAGRLNIRPVLLALAAEGLPPDEYARISRVFGGKVGNSYASTECAFLSYSCSRGWLHVNSDWAILEPVDADYRPVPPGDPSHTVLLTNMANRVQPILRYDLGDSILQRPDPCPCGNPLPAIRVQGRSADVLNFPTEGGGRVSIPPLALEVDSVPGVDLAQIVQTTPTSLRLRLRFASGADPDQVWQRVHGELKHLLASHKLHEVTIERAEEPPEQSKGGKFRQVIPHSQTNDSLSR